MSDLLYSQAFVQITFITTLHSNNYVHTTHDPELCERSGYFYKYNVTHKHNHVYCIGKVGSTSYIYYSAMRQAIIANVSK